MKRYQLLTRIFLVIFLTGSLLNFWRQYQSEGPEKEINALKIVLPNTENFSAKTGTPAHYKAFKTNSLTGEKEIAGIAFLTTDIAPEIRGYAGPIKIMAGMDTQGVITKVHLLSHSETPSYVMGMGKFLAQFSTLTFKNTFRLGEDIDGMTRATVSSESIARAVEKSAKTVATKVLNLVVPQVTAQKVFIPIDQILLPLFLFLTAILGIILHNDILRWLSLLGGFIYLGLLKSTMVSVVQIANIGLLKLPVFTLCPLWYLLVGLTLLTTLALGMVYCGSLCPFAFCQELLYNSTKQIFPKKIHISAPIDRLARYLKYIILFSSVFVSLILGNASTANFEPYILFFTAHASPLGWLLVIFILVVSLFHFRFWCKYLCPVGAFNGLLGRLSLFKIHIGDGCGGCEICARICPSEAIQINSSRQVVIDYPECILCGKCLEKCPQKTISIKKLSYAKKG